MKKYDRALVWFRRDLRHFDHAALHHALASSRAVYCAFIFDKDILDPLLAWGRQDRRVAFIHASVAELDTELKRQGGGMIVLHARAAEAIPQLADTLGVDAVFCNHDYEPSAIARDRGVAEALARQGRGFFTFKDQVLREKDEVLSLAGKAFSVFTPYKNAWMKTFASASGEADSALLPHYDCTPAAGQLALPSPAPVLPTLAAMGFDEIDL
ncbi:MAG: deoxyribodipyrimidine photo-lyase, partial [Burkholderiaceae bacterium]|nr:deoxyribodipyrimidine photo-lyase [Burkholderiaceae bacterium]